MSCTGETLARVAPAVQAEVQPRLRGLFGGFVRAYLPQTWVFRTELDAASLTVDAQGVAATVPHELEAPDVTVELPHGQLAELLATRGRRRPPAGTVKVTAHTSKGRAALGYLGPRLGL